MPEEPDFFRNLRAEIADGRIWLDRPIVLAAAVAAGLFVSRRQHRGDTSRHQADVKLLRRRHRRAEMLRC